MDLVSIIKELPVEVVLPAVGVIASVLVQYIKKWAKTLSPRMLMFYLIGISFIASALGVVLEITSSNPKVLGEHTAMIVGIATIVYRYVVQPVSEQRELARLGKEIKDAQNSTQPPQAVIATPAVAEPALNETSNTEVVITPTEEPETPQPVTPFNPPEFTA